MIRRFLSSCLVAVCVTGSSLAQDLAITNVTVFDGTGAEPYRATVMFDDGLISEEEFEQKRLAIIDALVR